MGVCQKSVEVTWMDHVRILWEKRHNPIPLDPVIRTRQFTTSLLDSRTPEQMFILHSRKSDDLYFTHTDHRTWFMQFYGVSKKEYDALEDFYVKGIGSYEKTKLFHVTGILLPSDFQTEFIVETTNHPEVVETIFMVFQKYLRSNKFWLQSFSELNKELVSFFNGGGFSKLTVWCDPEPKVVMKEVKQAYVAVVARNMAQAITIKPTQII